MSELWGFITDIWRFVTYRWEVIAGLAAVLAYILAAYWADRRKRREVAIEISQKFYASYGDFFGTWKLWNYSFDLPYAEREEIRKDLLDRATKSEAQVESMLLKLVCERDMTHAELEAVAKFRQAYQQLRSNVLRWGVPLAWGGTDDESYRALKSTAAAVGYLISSLELVAQPKPEKTPTRLLLISDAYWEGRWRDPLSEWPMKVPVLFQLIGYRVRISSWIWLVLRKVTRWKCRKDNFSAHLKEPGKFLPFTTDDIWEVFRSHE